MGQDERAPAAPGQKVSGRRAKLFGMLIRSFRWVAVVEAVSWLALIVATIVKYAADAPGGVQVMGPIHGTLFIVYVVLALLIRPRVGWNARALLTVLVESVIPGGGFLAARRPELQEKLSYAAR
jgi:integral membrane protein